MGSQPTPWTPFSISSTGTRWLWVPLISNHRLYHRHQRQQSTPVCMCICRSKNGRAVQMNFSRQIGAGRSVMRALFHYGQRYLQHLKRCYVSSGVTASRNVKPRALVRSTTFEAQHSLHSSVRKLQWFASTNIDATMMRNMMTLSSLNFSVVSFISLKLYSNLVVMKQMS